MCDKICPENAEKIDSWEEHFINERSKIWTNINARIISNIQIRQELSK